MRSTSVKPKINLQDIRALSNTNRKASDKWGWGYLLFILLGVVLFPWLNGKEEPISIAKSITYYLGIVIMCSSWVAIGFLSNAKGLYVENKKASGAWPEILLYYLILVPSTYFTIFWGALTFGSIGFNQVLVFIVISLSVFIVPIWLVFITLLIELFIFHFGMLTILNYTLPSASIVGIGSGMAFGCMMFLLLKNEALSRLTMQGLVEQLDQANDKLRSFSLEIEHLSTTKERVRIAREIHDTLGHSLTVVNVQLGAAKALIQKSKASQAEHFLQKATIINQQGLRDLRTAVSSLRSSPLDDTTLKQSLETLVSQSQNLNIKLEVADNLTAIPKPTAITLHRITQEALTNIGKHSQASQATIVLKLDEKSISLQIEDNGIGCESFDNGFGLLGIRERIQILNGETKINSSINHGFQLQVMIPR